MEKKTEAVHRQLTDLLSPTRLHLNCPECDSEIGAENINIDKAIAKCGNCNALMTFEDNSLHQGRRRPEVFMPKGIEVLKLRSELSIDVSWRKNSEGSSFLTLFTLIWNGILFPVALGAILSGNFHVLLFMGLHLAVGIGLAYYLLATFFNTTYITVNEYRMSIEHRPLKLPFYPNRDIPIFDIKQLYVEKYVSSSSNGQNNYSYAVQAILKDSKRIRLIKGIDDPQQALYVEQEVERFLDIPDKEVAEEWKG